MSTHSPPTITAGLGTIESPYELSSSTELGGNVRSSRSPFSAWGSDRVRVRNPQTPPRRSAQATASVPTAGPSNRPPPDDHANEDLDQSSDDEMNQGGGGLGQPLYQPGVAINRIRPKINLSVVVGENMELNAMGELYEPGAPLVDSVALVQIPWPTGGLPTEIFTDILLSALSYIHYDTSKNAPPALKWLYQVRLVSLPWRHIVDSAPAPLWVFIDSSIPLNIVDIALERSGVSLLSIRFRPNALTTASLFMEKIFPHIGRWKVVELQGRAWEYLPQTPAPRLQELILIDPNYEMSRARARGTFCGEFPSLQRLTLHHLSITGPLPTLGRNLRFLTIRQPSRGGGIAYTEIHRLLLLHSSLVEVELQASHWSQATPSPEMLEDVSLPSLRRFSLSELRYSTRLAWIPLLQKITAPNCTSFELVIKDLPDAHSDLLRAVEPFFASVITPVSRDLTVSLSFEFDFTLAIGRGDRTFKLKAWDPKPDAESVIVWVSDLLVRYRPNVTDLELVRFWTLSDEGLSNLFMALPDVTQFRPEGGFEATWRVLGKPVVPGVKGGPAQWLLPAMEKLAVLDQSGKEREDFIAMIQAREAAAAYTGSTRALAGHQPVRLKWLEYRGPAVLGPDERLPELLGDRFVFECIKYSTR